MFGGFVFAVSHLEIQYHIPAVLGDEIEVVTTPRSVRRVRFQLTQQVYRWSDQRKLATAYVTLACLTPTGKLNSLPESLVARLDADSPPRRSAAAIDLPAYGVAQSGHATMTGVGKTGVSTS